MQAMTAELRPRIDFVIANVAVLATFACAAVLDRFYPETYNFAVQEDRPLEWATFWGFLLAAVLFARTALKKTGTLGQFRWFETCLALFCFVVAMEEISWGQRVLGFESSAYFLDENFQQEVNVHNVMDSGIRVALVHLVLIGYGVVLSAAALFAPCTDVLNRIRIIAPPPRLIPIFLLSSLVYAWYPWSHTGEWIELTMAYGFVFAALADSDWRSSAIVDIAALVGIWCFSIATFFALRLVQTGDPRLIDAARQEIDALAMDFAGPHLHTRCNIHKRLYTFAREYGQTFVLEGAFAQLVGNSGDLRRGQFAIDPWGSPYWIRHKCADNRVAVFVYSFGPNRRRDSTDWEIRGDDLGAHLPHE